MNYTKYLVVLSTVFLVSCLNQPKSNVAEIVNEWKGKEIRFPSTQTFTKSASETVEMKVDTDFKLVVDIVCGLESGRCWLEDKRLEGPLLSWYVTYCPKRTDNPNINCIPGRPA